MEQFGSHWTGFFEIWYLRVFFRKSTKIRVRLKSRENVWCWLNSARSEKSHENVWCWLNSARSEKSHENVWCWLNSARSEKCFRQKIKTRVLFQFFSSEIRAVYEIMWERTQNALFHFHYTSGYANAPKCYDIRTLRVLLLCDFSWN